MPLTMQEAGGNHRSGGRRLFRRRGVQSVGVQSVSRVIDILHLFRPDMPLLGVVEISRQLGVDRSAVQRVIASLLEGDLVEQDPVSGKYRLGLGLLELAGTMLQGHNMPRVVQPFLRELADLVGECARLDLLYQGNSALQIAEATSANLIGYSDWTGRRLPLDCTASGRVLLAQMESKLLDETLGTLDLRARTAKTITNPAELCRELRTVRQQGYSITLENSWTGYMPWLHRSRAQKPGYRWH